MATTYTSVYGESLDLRDLDLSRLAFEYRNCQDQELLNMIADEIERRQKEQAEIVAALRMHEWHGIDRQCHNCLGDARRGHDADCATGKILARCPQ